jgi:hypothetical protein
MPARLHVTFTTYTPEATNLGAMEVVNDGTGSALLGNYHIARLDPHGAVVEQARLTQYPRELGPWELATQALLRLQGHTLHTEWDAPDVEPSA